MRGSTSSEPIRDTGHGLTSFEPISEAGHGLYENETIGNITGGVTSEFVVTKRRRGFTNEALEMAIQAVKSRAMNRFRASRTFGIPKTTLFRIVDADGNIKETGNLYKF